MKKIILFLVGIVGLTESNWAVLPNDITQLPNTIALQGTNMAKNGVPMNLNQAYTMTSERVFPYMQQREYESGTGQFLTITYNSDGSMSVAIRDTSTTPGYGDHIIYNSPTRDFATLTPATWVSPPTYTGFPANLGQDYFANGFTADGGPVGGIAQTGGTGGVMATATQLAIGLDFNDGRWTPAD